MDIEGAEKILLLLNKRVDKPIAMKVHGKELSEQFKAIGYKLKYLCLLTNR